MKVLSVKKYNEMKTAKWQKDSEEYWKTAPHTQASLSCQPQLAFYVFNKRYGYVAFDGKKALWDKTKKGVIAFWEQQEHLRKTRGY